MSLADLKKLVSPPERAFEVGTLEEWRSIEEKLGIKLPDDYRDFVFSYGSGLFAGLYRVYNPFSVCPFISLLPQSKRVCDYNRESQRSFPRRFPYPYYPEPGGLLPWGNDENGNDYFWLTEGTPNSWSVVQDNNRGRGIQVQPYSMTSFLVAILQRKEVPLASGYPGTDDYTFEPWEPSTAG